MIEKPIFQKGTFSSYQNISAVVKGSIYKYKSHFNPNNKNVVNARQYKEYFKFTIVRNPWSRAFSAYNNVMSDSIFRKKLNLTDTISLEEYIERFSGQGFLKSQLHWIKNLNGDVGVDYICRFENLNEDFEIVKKMIGAEFPELPHKIKGKGGDYRDYYSKEAIDLVAQKYAEEIKVLDYKFE